MTIPDRERKASPLSDLVTRNGVTVEVLLYCFQGTPNSWTLNVANGGSLYDLDRKLPTDRAA